MINVSTLLQIIETRNLLLQKLKNKGKIRVENADTSNTLDASLQKGETSSGEGKVTRIVNSMNRLQFDDEENSGQWFEGSDVSTATLMGNRRKNESEEDASFSDLEYEDNDLSSRSSASILQAQGVRAPSPCGSSDWVQLRETAVGSQKARQSLSRDKDSDVESSDWLKVGDSD